MATEATATFEDRVRSWEDEYLWDPATRSYPALRDEAEPDSPVRTPFQRDRDRIVHSKAFRRLKHKTQVFVAPEGDHYRTRLTHTLEACIISRTVARALGLNEDLTEAVGLARPRASALRAHRRGGAGRGAGGRWLPPQRALAARRRGDRGGRDGPGLNLTEQVRDGILRHGAPEAGDAGGAAGADRGPGRLHQPRHRRRGASGDHLRVRPAGRRDRVAGATGAERVDALVQDMVERSRAAGDIEQSEEVGGAMLRLRKFMFDRVYLGAEARGEQERARRALSALFEHYLAHPEELPSPDPEADPLQRVTDYLAG